MMDQAEENQIIAQAVRETKQQVPYCYSFFQYDEPDTGTCVSAACVMGNLALSRGYDPIEYDFLGGGKSVSTFLAQELGVSRPSILDAAVFGPTLDDTTFEQAQEAILLKLAA